MKNELSLAIKQICEEKGITEESVVETIEAALAAAYRKDFGEKNQNIKSKFDLETGKIDVYDLKTVVEDMEIEELEEGEGAKEAEKGKGKKVEKEKTKKDKEEKSEKKSSKDKDKEEDDDDKEEKKRFNPKTDIMLSEAQKIKKKYKIGDEIITDLEIPSDFGRMAAQTAKQVIIQKLREAERDTLYNELKDKEGDLVTGIIQRREGRLVLVDLGKAVALLPPEEQIDGERYHPGERYKMYIVSVNRSAKGPEIILSRSHPEMVRKIFEVEIPEVASGLIEIKSIAREAGARTKIAVSSNQDNVDPIGSCVGQRGSRVQTIINELGGEKIDIIEYHEDPELYIENALSPARIVSMQVNKKKQGVVVKVKKDQLSLAIGKGGQNVRLAAKLTNWKIDMITESDDGSEEKITEDGELIKNQTERPDSEGEIMEPEMMDETETAEEEVKEGEQAEEKDDKKEKKEKKVKKKKSKEEKEEEKKEKPEKK